VLFRYQELNFTSKKMKNQLLLWGLFWLCSISNAQSVWLQDGQEWVVEIGGGFGPPAVPINLIVLGDTTINGINCKTIRVPDGTGNLISVRYAYAQGNKVYSYRNNLQEFQKIYDFDANAGDTISIRRSVVGSLTQYVIDSTGTIDIDGFIRGIQYCKFVNSDILGPFQIIEGAGMTRPVNPLNPNNPRCAFFFIDYYSCQSFVDGTDTKLWCYKDEEISLSYTTNDCEVLLPVNNLAEDQGVRIKISPNPVHNQLNIEFQNAGNSQFFCVRDINGKMFHQQEVTFGTVQISTAGWPNGMYYIELRDSHNQIGCQKFVVIH